MSKWTMMLWCVDVFCFLNATVMATFFVSFVSRHPQHTLAQIREALGWPYHWPQVYFRFGFVLMVASLSLFFIMVMDVLEMSGCLAFCVATIILPMCYAMTRAFSIFAIEVMTVPFVVLGGIRIGPAVVFSAGAAFGLASDNIVHVLHAWTEAKAAGGFFPSVKFARDLWTWRAMLKDLDGRLLSQQAATRPLALVYVHRT